MRKKMILYGVTGELVSNVIDRWLIGIRETNPAILDIFRDRNVKPYRDLLMWSGEFAGKYLTSAYYAYSITSSERLVSYVQNFINELISYQEDNGYLGCFSDKCQMTGAFSVSPEKTSDTWDSWNHYHVMIGLLLWYSETGEKKYLKCVERIASFYLNHFYNGEKNLSEIGWTEMNLAVYHGFTLLYNITGKLEYLEFAHAVEDDMKSVSAEDYLDVGLSGMDFYACKKPRWESLHVIMGFAEMYKATGIEQYKRGFLALTDSILRTDVHNTGGFSTGEQAVGNPFAEGPIETCCVVAFNAMVRLAWEITKDIKYVEHLELAHYNASLGFWSQSGMWSTYDTPMNGSKKANFQDIVFQSRPGSPMLNCCSVNAPRGIAEIGEWLIREDNGEIFINSFEDCDYVKDDTSVVMRGGYPYRNEVEINIKSPVKCVKIRIPKWSVNTELFVNGEKKNCVTGEYFTLSGSANIKINFDFSPRILLGAMEKEGKISVYSGCILFAADATHNPHIDLNKFRTTASEVRGLTVFSNGSNGFSVKLGCAELIDFYHAGQSGCDYITWFETERNFKRG